MKNIADRMIAHREEITSLRLDPFNLPQTVSCGYDENGEPVSFTVHEKGVVARRVLEKSGLPLSMMLGLTAYRGVAAEAKELEGGRIDVTLSLLHEDPNLTVPLLVADNLDDIAADWHLWSEKLGLQMLLIESDGVARTLEESLGAVKKSQPSERRAGRPTRARRPRFLARRRTGSMGMRLIVDGQEIIARQ
ncbi:DUF6101 family protein [Notoacmeibacter sp. MSK16QG-6]|uniref:DUF6101 family protein n=1 Tax=Notoacmeibacter sp. MSK16QG-6 TaxID=2957982 RepID=UPI00209CF639|nr:DUF6101 family protein [Notoacmeibacter sp. MSK16QG-6]MCP1198247.1 DUF6101 family protein [Notoacmeibacter sp. MSK16QG-6]